MIRQLTDGTTELTPSHTVWETISSRWRRSGLRELLPFLGPAFLVSVGYMDPGNWGTDIEGGARFGYQLLWVILLSNIMAIFLQSLSAKLGIVSNRTLAENCRVHYPRPLSIFLWITAEFAAMATDLAEFLGAALGFYLLFGIPLFPAALLAGAVVFLTLNLYRYGYRVVEYVILGYVSIIGLAYVLEVYLSSPEWTQIVYHTVVPRINSESILVAVGILGATVMPHNLYLHSGLVQSRLINGSRIQNSKHVRFAIADSIIGLNMAFFINAAILIMSAAVFNRHGIAVASIEEAHNTLRPLLGELSAGAFAVALLCSGLSSSTTGTLAGQMIFEGFLNLRIPLWFRRAVTMIPALIVIALGWDPLKILVLSQVSLSLQLPFAVVPLIHFTSSRKILGDYANRPLTVVLAILAALVIIGLNGLLLFQVFGGQFSL
ncbi:MAG: Nramp family divalent metal transporter [Armatimonadota bacterium]|nr:Nramp family divalent metal transporter [Armatimonadota bacterium]MDR5703719.1 Nramp family divalent metal transporter [Armatimonadota bacterium]